MDEMRKHITDGSFLAFKQSFLANYEPADEEIRRVQKEKWLKAQYKKFNESF